MKHKHNLNHWHLTTMNMGQLVPISCVEVLHGDRFRHAAAAMIRFSPLLAPVMHPLRVSIHHWYVPNRILWDEWEGFLTGRDTNFTFPTVTVPVGGSPLLDHLGVPPSAEGLEINALPVRAYNKIVEEKYFDQDIDTPPAADSLDLQFARWEKDYFSTARTTSQQGDEVQIPFSGGTIPVSHNETAAGSNLSALDGNDTYTGLQTSSSFLSSSTTPVDQSKRLEVNMADASGGINVTDFRVSMALQRFKEARSRWGSRYADYLRYYGINPSDGRLQRPEYLGGGRQTVAFSEVLATAEDATNPIGTLKGHGIATVRTRPYRRFFEEHGHVITLMCVRPKAIYTQSLNRNWLRRVKEDYWQRELEIVGQQPVTEQELYAVGNPATTFGWVDRYLEYRGVPSYVSGDFRKSTSNFWHLGRDFATAPGLNSTFLECNPSNRIFADTNQPQLYCMTQQFLNSRRLVSKRART